MPTQPRNADQLFEAALAAQSAGNLDAAQSLAEQALKLRPEDLQSILLAGIIRAKQNLSETAVPLLEKGLSKDPTSFDATFWLSVTFRQLNRIGEAAKMGEKATRQDPASEYAQNQLGICYLDLGRADDAAACFQKACEIDPKVAPFFENLGRAYQAMGRTMDAILAYRQVLQMGQVRPAALFRLGDAYMSVPLPEPAADCARSILRMNPNSAPGNLLLARSLIASGKVAEGAQYALRASELSPGNAVPIAFYGRALQSLGQMEEADAQFKKSIELEPRQGFAYYALTHNGKVRETDRPMVEKMQELLHDAGLPKKEIIQLEYGLGKSFEDLGDYEAAMNHFDRANKLDHEIKVGVAPFVKQELDSTAKFLISTFSKEFFIAHSQVGSGSEVPVFVVGMMRSGTTLAEQILSSHPLVGGVGEQLFWPENAGSGQKLFGRIAPGGYEMGSGFYLDSPRLKSLGQQYLTLLESLAPGNIRIVDKMNTNYLLLGLLHTAYPNARIVHMKRHPVDTCLSIWATPVAEGIDLCASKDNIVYAYEKYLQIMDHWRAVLPSDRFLDVQYEELVSDQERVTRRMVEFCGLEWSDACLQPEKNQRAVKTPSVWQVRQPVYKTSMERWRKYEPWLGDFSRLLPS